MNSQNTLCDREAWDKIELLEALVDGRELPRGCTPYPSDRIIAICRHAQKNCSRTVTLKEVSRLVGLHPHHVSTIFRNRMGIGYRTFLSKCRVRRSCELLQSRDLLMSSVAEMAGFRSVSQFNRSFLQHMRMTPSAFRKNMDLQSMGS